MKQKHALTERLAQLRSWRHNIHMQITRIGDVLRDNAFATPAIDATLDQLSARALAERVTMVFIAEIARGKSELVNAMFFTDLGRRLLPTGLGRTTRCVTEIRFDRDIKTSIRLLPIETRESPRTFAELANDPTVWTTVLFDADQPESVTRALATLSETRRISLVDAVSWGLHGDGVSALTDDDGVKTAVVPRWRHAIVNFPHPLLDAGLVILDTPSLSWFAAEPELARHRVESADGVALVLDITEGVTKRDFAVWREYLDGARSAAERKFNDDARPSEERPPQARVVVLNKIDDLDIDPDLKGDAAERALLKEIDRRVIEIADRLQTAPINVVPISAKLGLIGKLANDHDKAIKSRLYQLERALTSNLPRTRQDGLNDEIIQTLSDLLESSQAALDEERFKTLESLSELSDLRQKNQTLLSSIAARTQSRQERVFNTLSELRSIKATHLRLGEDLAGVTSVEAARRDIDRTKKAIVASLAPSSTLDAVEKYFRVTEEKLDAINLKVEEIRALFANLGNKLKSDFGIKDTARFNVAPFPTQRFHTEFNKVRDEASPEFSNATSVLMSRGSTLARQFDENVAARTVRIFEIAQRETVTWVRGLYKSLERPLEDAYRRLEARTDSIDKVRLAEIDLAEQIALLQAQLDVLKRKHGALAEARGGLERFAGKRADLDAA
jgi:hypothetical protein